MLFISIKIDVRDFGIEIGNMRRGKLNRISDVAGVKVGHSTICETDYRTGVTAVIPKIGDVYREKLVGGVHVINGFGKTTGLMQIDELGQLESPILLTNTLNVGKVQDALVEYMLGKYGNPDEEFKTFNPVVAECNDSYLSRITGRPVEKRHVFEAIENAGIEFEEGSVGAGAGMSCHGFKGGIGSSSRVFMLNGEEYVLGVMVLSNHGIMRDLTVNGARIGCRVFDLIENEECEDRGSIIIIVATDVPLCSRQLGRICKRCVVGMSRLGSYIGHGSGEIAIAFSTAGTIPPHAGDILNMAVLNENKMDVLFRAAAESTEEAILSSMLNSPDTTGYKGHRRRSLRDFAHLLNPEAR